MEGVSTLKLYSLRKSFSRIQKSYSSKVVGGGEEEKEDERMPACDVMYDEGGRERRGRIGGQYFGWVGAIQWNNKD